MEPIVNKVAKSGLITIDLQSYCDPSIVSELDIKDFLFQELLLKEKDFRDYLDKHDWSQYEGKVLAVYCSTDAILAPWAFMLVVTHARPYAEEVILGNRQKAIEELYRRAFEKEDWSRFAGQRVIVKGCGDEAIPEYAYLAVTQYLMPHVDRLMYGEACSFVPVYRKPKI
jgi:hypothetical protein